MTISTTIAAMPQKTPSRVPNTPATIEPPSGGPTNTVLANCSGHDTV